MPLDCLSLPPSNHVFPPNSFAFLRVSCGWDRTLYAFFNSVPTLLTVTIINTAPKATWRGRLYFSLQFIPVHHEEAETWRQVLKRDKEAKLTCVLSMARSVCFSTPPGTMLLWGGPTHSGLDLPTSIHEWRKCPHKHAYEPIWWRHFLT